MQRITAKVQIGKTLESLGLTKGLRPGVLDSLTDSVLLSVDPQALLDEFVTAQREPKSRTARQIRKLVRLTSSGTITPTLAIGASIG